MKQTYSRILLSLMAVALVLVAIASPGASLTYAAPNAQAKLTITAAGGYGDEGSFILGEWFPIRVTLTNPAGGQSMRVRVEVDSQSNQFNHSAGTYMREIDLAPSARKEVTLYAYSGNFARSMDVRVAQGSTVIDKVSVKLNPLERASTVLVGVISSDAVLLNILKSEPLGHVEMPLGYSNYGTSPYGGTSSTPTEALSTITHVELSALPTLSAALDSLGAIVIDDVDTGQLTAEQKQALVAWVARGGSLTVVARPGATETATGLADLLPVTLDGTPRTLTGIQSLGDLVAIPITATSPVVVSNATLKTDPIMAARALAQQDGTPLVAMRDLGMGQVIYLALSPSIAPLKGWDGLVPLFKRLMADHPLRTSLGAMRRNAGGYGYGYGYFAGPGKVFDTYGSIFDWPGLEMPNPMLICLFLFLYIIVIGPVNFIILRRMRRAELAWLTIPALVVVFCIGAYILAYQSKGGDLVAIRANLVQTVAGTQRANVTQVLGLFSPTRDTYRLEVGEDSGITEINSYGYGGDPSNVPIQVLGGSPTTIDNVKINTWTLRGFMAENTVAAESPLEADLRMGDNMIEGIVRNRTGQPLHDVALIRGAAYQHIGLMAPGQRAEVKLSVTSYPFPTSSSPTNLMPLPPGVVDPSSQGGYYGSPSTNTNNPDQRAYNRRVEFLNMALYPLLSDSAPTNLNVLALAWGPSASSDFRLTGHTADYSEANIWMNQLPVLAGQEPRMKADTVPFAIYAPGNEPAWVTRLPNNATINFTINPYADILYRLPPGTRPTRLALQWSFSVNSQANNVVLMAYNVRTGKWDRIGTLDIGQGAVPGIQSPSDYVGPAGDVTIRLLSESGAQIWNFTSLDLMLNETP
ncbi:MAG TPA: hypothetical protein VEX13_08230 [Chloroflexia bacterium]|nr:hypothetical protein [Chloroflexia bacterium]